MELLCAIQKYAWGVCGNRSSVAALLRASGSCVEILEKEHYAELWMGTHPNGPSLLKENGQDLKSFIETNPHVLGRSVIDTFGLDLPFLFKVLSVSQALSIQVHPNKSHAEELHRSRPEVYKDPNHKPEMAVALTPFEALCGFRPASEISTFLTELPELEPLLGKEATSDFLEAPSEELLKRLFEKLMKAPEKAGQEVIDALSKRFSNNGEVGDKFMADLYQKLVSQYPGDSSCLAIYFLNYIVLQPGQALFLGPNMIHAYLKGDCMECMACSDNVVRAGLTPKYKDVETLLGMLDYSMTNVEDIIFKPEVVDSYLTLFVPPVSDFAIEAYKIPKSVGEYDLRLLKSANILIVIEGSASLTSSSEIKPIHKGSVLFLPSEEKVTLNISEDILAYRAFCNVHIE